MTGVSGSTIVAGYSQALRNFLAPLATWLATPLLVSSLGALVGPHVRAGYERWRRGGDQRTARGYAPSRPAHRLGARVWSRVELRPEREVARAVRDPATVRGHRARGVGRFALRATGGGRSLRDDRGGRADSERRPSWPRADARRSNPTWSPRSRLPATSPPRSRGASSSCGTTRARWRVCAAPPAPARPSWWRTWWMR